MSDIELDIPRLPPSRYDPTSLMRRAEWWTGALESRISGRSLSGRHIIETESREAIRDSRPPIPEMAPHDPDVDQRRLNDEMLKAIESCRKTKGDVTRTRAFHRWLSQGTNPGNGIEDEIEGEIP